MNDIKYIEGTKHISIIGEKFNLLTVIGVNRIERLKKGSDNRNRTRIYYNCVCDCGNKHVASSMSLKNGQVKSCGCLKLKIYESKKKTNRYEFFDNYVVGYDCKGMEFYFDLEDYDRVKEFCWNGSLTAGYFTACRVLNGKKTSMKLHRVILNCIDNPEIVVDHIRTLDKWDNRKSNLRVVTKQQNMFNSKLSKNNKSGFIGVYWSKKDESWYSQIKYSEKITHLGYTKTKEQAIIQRLEDELKYFGAEFAPQRHLFKEYNIGVNKFISENI